MKDDDRGLTREPVPAVDMSSEAIDRRLRDLGQMYQLSRELANVRYLGKVRDVSSDPPGACPSAEPGSREPRQ